MGSELQTEVHSQKYEDEKVCTDAMKVLRKMLNEDEMTAGEAASISKEIREWQKQKLVINGIMD